MESLATQMLGGGEDLHSGLFEEHYMWSSKSLFQHALRYPALAFIVYIAVQ